MTTVTFASAPFRTAAYSDVRPFPGRLLDAFDAFALSERYLKLSRSVAREISGYREHELDRAGSRQSLTTLSFFLRMSTNVCDAIADEHDPRRIATLKCLLGRIEDTRLRQAMMAAIRADLEECIPPTDTPSWRSLERIAGSFIGQGCEVLTNAGARIAHLPS